jgi:hypothetical protein
MSREQRICIYIVVGILAACGTLFLIVYQPGS